MPDKDQRTMAALAETADAGSDDVGPERRPVAEPAEKIPPAQEKETGDRGAERRSADAGAQGSAAPPAPDVSKPVPAGIDPLVAPLIDHLEDQKRTRLPYIRAGGEEFGGDPDIAAAAQEIAAGLARAESDPVEDVQARLQAEFDLTMSEALEALGPAWLRSVRGRLARKRKHLEKPAGKRKAGPKPDPALIESDMAEQRLEEASWLSHRIESVRHAWVIAKREEVRFKTAPIKRPPLNWKGFGPERESPEKERVPTSKQPAAKEPGVAPELRGFTDLVAERFPGFTLTNYAGHGGGKFKGAGFSADIRLPGSKVDERGFYASEDVIKFLLVVDQVAAKNGAQWRVLYNDYDVAKGVSEQAKRGYVQFMGQPFLGQKEFLNYHGPAPLKLHLHIDVAITASLPPKQ
jgi:hypothetical protein